MNQPQTVAIAPLTETPKEKIVEESTPLAVPVQVVPVNNNTEKIEIAKTNTSPFRVNTHTYDKIDTTKLAAESEDLHSAAYAQPSKQVYVQPNKMADS